MPTLTPQDVAVRLYYAKCCVGDKSGEFINKLKRGSWNDEDERKLALLTALVEVIENYCPLGGEVEEGDNYISDAEAQHVFELISELCGICFAPIGHEYE
jgi:hypothetical protein